MHRSRLCYVTIDANDLDVSTAFWQGALRATEDPFSDVRGENYRRLRLPHSDLGVIIQHVPEPKTSKTRMHLCIESDDVDAEAERLSSLGATLVNVGTFGLRVMTDPAQNEFCVIQLAHPELVEATGNTFA